MHPILFRFTHPLSGELVEIHSYGVLILLGFLAGTVLVYRNARHLQLRYQQENILSLLGMILVGSILGAKFFDILFALPSYLEAGRFSEAIFGSGLMFWGGIMGGLTSFVWYCRRYRLDTLSWLDLFAPALALGQVFGRLGCFMAGCCYGSPTSCSLGLVFSHPDNHITPQGIPLHPTQLYESAFALLLFILLQLLFLHRKPRVTGGLMAIYLAAYAVFRFMVEFIRADPRGELIAGILTPSQTISLAMLVLSVWLLFGKKK